MKKFLIFAVVVGGLGLATTACKKDHTCSCTTTTTGGGASGTVTTDTTFTDIKKGDAETKCDGLESSGDVFGITWDTQCELK